MERFPFRSHRRFEFSQRAATQVPIRRLRAFNRKRRLFEHAVPENIARNRFDASEVISRCFFFLGFPLFFDCFSGPAEDFPIAGRIEFYLDKTKRPADVSCTAKLDFKEDGSKSKLIGNFDVFNSAIKQVVETRTKSKRTELIFFCFFL